MILSDRGLDLIRGFEGLRLSSYKDQAGLPTIGYGHLIKPGETFDEPITADQALSLLRTDAEIAVSAVNAMVTVPLEQHQFDALVSFLFNAGAAAFKSSTMLRRLNAGDYDLASEFAKWVYIHDPVTHDPVVSVGLTKRRAREISVWEGP